MKKNDYKKLYPVQTVEFIPISDLLEKNDTSGDLLYNISEGAPFTWGDNNRSLVTVHRLLEHCEDALSDSGEDGERFIAALKALPHLLYIDMEN